MNSQRAITIMRWTLAFAALAGIVLVFRRWLHVNPTTVALSLLLLVLLLAAEWGLRYAVVVAVVAAVCFNFFFLPPIETFVVSDPQNWLALFAFLVTAILASRLSESARREASEARRRQLEVEALFRLSRELLQSESVASLLSSIPASVASGTGATFALLYMIEGERLYQAGSGSVSEVELPHLRKLAVERSEVRFEQDEVQIPVRSGVRPRGLVVLRGVSISRHTAEAIGSLISIATDRSQALENVARGEAAKESERLRTLMIDSITHDLRTPLTSIKGAATTLLAGGVNEEGSRDLLSIIDEECDRLNQLVAEAVEMAQLDAQQVQMHFRPVAVIEIVREARRLCAWVEEQHTLNVHVPESVQITADPAMMVKVLCNLLENAAKYSRAGTAITVTASARKDRTVEVSVADRGVGIDASEQQLIFERFYRSPSSGMSASGTGMGLAISRAIVEAHGGQIRVTSQVGHGSVFTMELPGE